MYDELVKRLRTHNGWALNETLDAAADAIEKLQQNIEQYKLYLQDAINDLHSAHEKEPKWIPVTERLPKDQRPVLVYVPPYTDGEEEYVGYVGMAYFTYSPNGGFWCGTDGNIYGAIGIIHEPLTWMPLPEPPKEDKL